ncbi:terpene synthase family protein [Actinomadura rubrisoli]|uniref:Terpene synthase n=1 Tax=Actinomadura rubrisoli TaxID=2530368 RepID=A0A4V2YYW4_9ACTN|nr:terpene synthase family protein [Actinomadura rubrisoli]TDD94767.1 hypothetical protein E1298_06250 [Actinomadura rubrisoli]
MQNAGCAGTGPGADPAGACRPLDVLAAADAAVVTARLAERSAAWAGRLGPPFDPALAALCSLPAAFVAPWLSGRGADLAARTGLWIFALDAWTDGPPARRDPVRLHTGLDALQAVAGGAPPAGGAPGGALGDALAEIRDGVAASPAVLPWWRRAVDATLAGARFEYEAARRAEAGVPAPPLEEYLRHGAASIALAPLVLAMWSDMPGPGLPEVLPALRRPLRDACLAVRLANDLRGHRRERDEGVLDALALGLPAARARDRIALYVARCRRALRPLIGPVPGPALALERQLLWSVRHYERTDAGHAA